ncbi:MAG TPA: permease [bacterium]
MLLEPAIDWLVHALLGLEPGTRAADIVQFFLYDSAKILALLFVMIGLIGFLRTYLPRSRIRAWLTGCGGWAYAAAAVFGAVTPFCSCSSIPIFLGFLAAGIPLGVAFAFLITSPLINEYLVVLMLGFFGARITALYVVSGLAIGIGSGLVLGRLKLERHLVADLTGGAGDSDAERAWRLQDRVRFGLGEAREILAKIWLWVLAGVGVGAVIHNLVPAEAIQDMVGLTGIWSVPLATALGVPMYGSCAAIVPIAVVLFQKGMPLGTALAFMMAITALSLPEAVMLRRAMRLHLIAVFFGVTAAAIMLTGYLFNALSAWLRPL